MNIEIREPTQQQEPALANLLQMYLYELTNILDFDLSDEGFYMFDNFSSYWTDNNKFPFLVYVDDKITGFVLVQKGSPVSATQDIWDIDEFFVMRKFRHQGVGTTIANTVWQRFKGPWQVRVLHKNTEALKFWEYAIHKFTGDQPNKTNFHMNNNAWYLFKFTSV